MVVSDGWRAQSASESRATARDYHDDVTGHVESVAPALIRALLGAVLAAGFGQLAAAPGTPLYRSDVAPVLERRCVVCHACYDAPCQLNLGSWQGLARGASAQRVYDGARLKPATPTRLFIDAQSPGEWRALGFHPVLPEAPGEAARSLLTGVLAQKAAHPLPEGPVLPDAFDFSLDRAQTCPQPDAFERYVAEHPQGGMPYGLPALSEAERDPIERWVLAGAPIEPDAPPPEDIRAQVDAWERFLNGASLRERLMSRYLYEHLFIGHLQLIGRDGTRWFTLIRSQDPPGERPEPIATRQPFDDPGEAPFYYRLAPLEAALVAKTHMPYRLDAERMARWRALFLDGLPPLASLPGYGEDQSANPFTVFRDIPVASRYRFLLDDAGYFVDGFIKGPVCRGQVALNVINDRFWVFFADPSTHTDAADAFLARHADSLRLPGESVSAVPLVSWNTYREREAAYLEARARFLREAFGTGIPLDMTVVWDGDGHNPNAALTVFRHFDSASVVRGLVGDRPKTAWLITYPILERIHYLLVAGFDVFGNVGHQLNSRLYMDFLRMESETNLLALLPLEMRPKIVEGWYRGNADEVKAKFYDEHEAFGIDTAIRYRSDDPLSELFGLLQARVAPVRARRFDVDLSRRDALGSGLARLASLRGESLQWLPELVFLRIEDGVAGARDFTVLRNSAHTNISHLFAESLRRVPEEDSLTVARGLLGAHPNAFYRLRRADLPALAEAIGALDGEAGYARLADRFAVRRTDPGFWSHLDSVHAAAREADATGFGLFDLNRLENR
ncbi:MAG: fatty acid cis/trans isomerase [Rhodocyclaceae bacterium]|nr:fatty acid cis/trans isomerase [Rhodocyclaceae bacterium]